MRLIAPSRTHVILESKSKTILKSGPDHYFLFICISLPHNFFKIFLQRFLYQLIINWQLDFALDKMEINFS
jgi:hypothetical protein